MQIELRKIRNVFLTVLFSAFAFCCWISAMSARGAEPVPIPEIEPPVQCQSSFFYSEVYRRVEHWELGVQPRIPDDVFISQYVTYRSYCDRFYSRTLDYWDRSEAAVMMGMIIGETVGLHFTQAYKDVTNEEAQLD